MLFWLKLALSVCLPIIDLPTHLSIHSFIHLHTYLSMSLSIHPFYSVQGPSFPPQLSVSGDTLSDTPRSAPHQCCK